MSGSPKREPFLEGVLSHDPLGVHPIYRLFPLLAAGFLYRVGAETTPNFQENLRVSLRMIFSAGPKRGPLGA